MIGRSVRNEDVVARFGGEEIAIILRAIELGPALLLADRVRRVVATSATALPDDKQVHVTVSVGVASLPDLAVETVAELVDAADQALYRAKHAGRDRVSR